MRVRKIGELVLSGNFCLVCIIPLASDNEEIGIIYLVTTIYWIGNIPDFSIPLLLSNALGFLSSQLLKSAYVRFEIFPIKGKYNWLSSAKVYLVIEIIAHHVYFTYTYNYSSNALVLLQSLSLTKNSVLYSVKAMLCIGS
jgi:hypothetical protein